MAQARIGVGGLAKEVGGMVGNFAKAHPILTAVAAAAARLAARAARAAAGGLCDQYRKPPERQGRRHDLAL